MIKTEDINQILQITESFQMPERLMSILMSKDKDAVFDRFMALESDLSFDWFTDYFQEEHSNRTAMMQDYTPKELTGLLPELSNDFASVLDVCAGIGGLSIGAWRLNPNAFFVCEELSERSLPLLLFNLSIRNVNGYVINKDVLTGDAMAIYRLQNGEKYSSITQEDMEPQINDFDLIVSNPPYSLKHEWSDVLPDYLTEYGAPPTKAADFAFVLYGLKRLKADGQMFLILPHGVLFRGQREGEIRKKLLEENRVDAVIGLPEKLFLNTQIPVCILSVRQKANQIIFIDASKGFEKNAKQNRLRNEDVEKCVDVFRSRKTVDKYSRIIQMDEIIENDYNLNIPRYVDTSEEEPLPKLNEILSNLTNTQKAIDKTEKELCKLFDEMAGSSEDMKLIKQFKSYLKKEKASNEQYTFDL